MAKIRNLHSRPLADGTVAWHWKPSPRLRKLGWQNHALGSGPSARRGKPEPPADVLTRALELNRQLEEWQRGGAAIAAANKPALRKWLFGDLVDAYRASDAYRTEIKPATRKEYDSRIGQLSFWAQDGQLPIRSIDKDMVLDLKKALLEDGGSKFKCAAMLRVLRLLMRWAREERLLTADPTEGVSIPSPPSRSLLLTWRDVQDIAALPDIHPLAARALRIGFWSMLRREDLRGLNRFQWRELHGADPRDLPALVNAKGQVWGFRVQPEKTLTSTGTWVDCPMPPFLHAEIEAAFGIGAQAADSDSANKASQWLFPHPRDPAKPMDGYLLRRHVKPALVAGGFPTLQLRDTRRSGMSGVCDMGADRGDVYAISGHPLDGQQKTMADVYMPPNTKKACRAIAAACRTLAAIEAREKEQAE